MYCDCCGQYFEYDWDICRNNLCPECSRLLNEDRCYDKDESFLLDVGEFITENEFDSILTKQILKKEY